MASTGDIATLPGMGAMAAPLSAVLGVNTASPNVSTAAAVSTGATNSPRVPRRESKDVARGMLSKQPRAAMRGVAAAASNASTPAPPGASTTTSSSPAASGATGAAADDQRAATAPTSTDASAGVSRPRSRRWNLIKKDVLPNPLLMQISERVQLIISYVAHVERVLPASAHIML